MDELFECYNYSNSRRVEIAVSHLKGDALNWWIREASERRRLKYTKISSWIDSKQLLRQRYLAPQNKETYVQEKAQYSSSCVPQDQLHIHINQPIYLSKHNDIIQAKEDSIISNQSSLQNIKTIQNREDAKVTHTKVPLETEAEMDSKIKSNPIIAPLNVAAAQTKEEDQLGEILVRMKPNPPLSKELDREVYNNANIKESPSMRNKADYSRLWDWKGKDILQYPGYHDDEGIVSDIQAD